MKDIQVKRTNIIQQNLACVNSTTKTFQEAVSLDTDITGFKSLLTYNISLLDTIYSTQKGLSWHKKLYSLRNVDSVPLKYDVLEWVQNYWICTKIFTRHQKFS